MSVIVSKALTNFAVISFGTQIQNLTVTQNAHLFFDVSVQFDFINAVIHSDVKVVFKLPNLGQVRNPLYKLEQGDNEVMVTKDNRPITKESRNSSTR